MWHGRQGELPRSLAAAPAALSGIFSPGSSLQDANYELYLATEPSLASVTGQYFVSNRKQRPAQVAQDKATRQRLWELLEQQSGQKF